MSRVVGVLRVNDSVDNRDTIYTNYGGDYVKSNIHFIVLKYIGDSEDARSTFKRICYRYDLGETWFIRGSRIANSAYVLSVSFRPFPWSRYRDMLFDKGIERSFRDMCLKNKCGHIYIGEVRELLFKMKSRRKSLDTTLQKSLSALLFNK